MSEAAALPVERIARAIVVIRGQKVLLDEDLAALFMASRRAGSTSRCGATRIASRQISCSR